MTKLTSLLAASVRKRNTKRLANMGLTREITNTSVAVTDSIITDGISLALEELNFDSMDFNLDGGYISYPYSENHGGTEVRTSLPNVAQDASHRATHSGQASSAGSIIGPQENHFYRMRLHNNWKSNSDPYFRTLSASEENLRSIDCKLKEHPSLDPQELLERIESVTSTIIEEIQINLLEEVVSNPDAPLDDP